MSLTLRWFQEEAVESSLRAWEQGIPSTLISAPTGAGKTIIFSEIARRALSKNSKRAIILAHRDSLLSQAAEKLRFVWPNADLGFVQSGVYDFSKQITIASVQTLCGRIHELLINCQMFGPIDYIIVDEAHHAYASSWRRIIEALKEKFSPKILGVTATPIRTKKNEALSDVFEHLAYSISIFQLIQEGYLSPVVSYNIETNLNLKGVKKSQGDYNVKDLSRRVAHSNFNRMVIDAWKERARGRKCICFAVDVAHVDQLTVAFRKAGAKAIGIYGQMSRDEQREVLSRFRDGNIDVLINCYILTEGFDEPAIDCVLMARPTTSKTLFVQMVGRGLRLYPGKKDCLLLDLTSSSEKSGLITMEDIIGFYGLQNTEKIYKERRDLQRNNSLVISPDTIPALQAANIYGEELASSPVFNENDLFDINKFAWATVDGNHFVTVRNNLALGIYKEQGKYVAYLVCNDKKEGWKCRLSDPVDYEFALAIANVYLFDYGKRNITLKKSDWRARIPSEKQLTSLKNYFDVYKRFSPATSINLLDVEKTSGAYSDMITAFSTYVAIKGNRLPLIDKEAATENLRLLIIRELKEDSKIEPPDMQRLVLDGEFTSSDKKRIKELIVSLNAIPYGKFPVEFMLSNPIVFKGNVVEIIHKNYPRYPLTTNQLELLNRKIKMVFRLYFRGKSLSIVEGVNARKQELLYERDKFSKLPC